MSREHGTSLYIDLESILDFRLATLSLIDDEFAASLLTDSRYVDRNRDDLWFAAQGKFDVRVYSDLYRARDATYLQHAKPTAIFWLLGKIISEHMVSTAQPHGFKDIEVVINAYPFVLSEDATSVMENAVSIYLDAKVAIRSIYEDPATISPYAMKSRFTDVIMYDFNYWVMAHQDVLAQAQMHPCVIYTPAIMRGPEPDQEKMADIRNEFKDNVNPFEWTAQWLMDVVSLRYVDVRHFSIELFKFPVGQTE